jgi:hypothetical protein
MRWVEWKEKDTLPPSEYEWLVNSWDRKLRMLSRKLLEARSDDEEILDSRLYTTRKWIHSKDFIEPLVDWKEPGAAFKGFSESALDFGIAFYVDDIKLENFDRKGRVVNDLMMEVYEIFKREGIEVPFPQQEVWLRDRDGQLSRQVGNGSERTGTFFEVADGPTPPTIPQNKREAKERRRSGR